MIYFYGDMHKSVCPDRASANASAQKGPDSPRFPAVLPQCAAFVRSLWLPVFCLVIAIVIGACALSGPAQQA